MPVLDTLMSGLSSSLFQEVTRMTETINKTKRICSVFFFLTSCLGDKFLFLFLSFLLLVFPLCIPLVLGLHSSSFDIFLNSSSVQLLWPENSLIST